MSKQEFLNRLEYLLRDIPQSERREAMEYYRSYFEDAGPENEAKIIEELGSPQEVAASIKKNLFGEDYEEFEFEEKQGQTASKTRRNILIAVLIVLTFPLWVGVAGTLFGILVAGFFVLFGLALAAVAIAGAFLVAGFALLGVGIAKLFTGFPAIGLIVVAISMFMLAIAVLGIIVIVWVAGSVLPKALRAVVRLCKKPFQKRGALI